MSEMTSPSPPSSALVAHISAQSGSLPSARRLTAVLLELGLGCRPPPGRRRRTCTCPSCRASRSCRPADTAARRTGRRRSSSRSRCTGPCECRTTPSLGLVDAVHRADRDSTARRSSACRRPRSSARPGAPSLIVTTRRRLMAPGHLRERAGGAEEGAAVLPKMAALLAEATLGAAADFHGPHDLGRRAPGLRPRRDGDRGRQAAVAAAVFNSDSHTPQGGDPAAPDQRADLRRHDPARLRQPRRLRADPGRFRADVGVFASGARVWAAGTA